MADCPGCNLPMIEGQVFNGLLKCHWDCQNKVRADMGDTAADAMIQSRINQRLAMDNILPSHPLFTRLGGKV
ncbi:hypothetical protein PHB09_131 [Pseudomonas phage PHB09]|uniref:Uncharacterized protein n=1 Tax=Pseudomonas phage PHB09 TaxID=2867265 RepID=A0AAE8XCX4_9CAUD|nr:hypothetical protein QGX10_gp130 [Pseudomonas phage PHB09]UAV84626.1 hypothetical protein PHB09_131 [Pseudomonas phage PHB09]